MLTTQKRKPRPNLADLTVFVYGPRKIGKCVSGKTQLIDPATGRPTTIDEFVKRGDGTVLTMREAGMFGPERPAAYLANPPDQLCRLVTQTGREIEATAGHPFLTRDGWKPLSTLDPATDRVAVVAEYPDVFGSTRTEDCFLRVLAYLIADGSLTNDSPVFTKNEHVVRSDFEEAIEACGDECAAFTKSGGGSAVRVRGKKGGRNNVTAFLREVGLDGLRSSQKFLPDFVFGLRREKMALFLNRLFTCDGSAETSGRRLSYSSTSIRMVRQVQHLLLRFGIVSTVRPKYRDDELYGAELLVASKANVLRFIDEIGFFGEKAERAEAIRDALYAVRESETQLDRLGPVLFDRIRSIEPTEVAPVYDLTVDGSHNFIANDFVVHNSTWCSQADEALFLATEPGLNHIEVYEEPIVSWDELLVKCREIAEGKHAFKTVIVDTVDNAYRMCAEHICQKFKIEHESDLGYGKGYALVNNEFYRVLNKLALLPYGLFLVSHSQERELETRTGKHTKVVPTLPKKAREIVLGMADMILFCDLELTKSPEGKPAYRRVLRTKPSVDYEAGDRTGRLPETIDLDFARFVEAYGTSAAAAAAAAPSDTPQADKAGAPEPKPRAATAR